MGTCSSNIAADSPPNTRKPSRFYSSARKESQPELHRRWPYLANSSWSDEDEDEVDSATQYGAFHRNNVNNNGNSNQEEENPLINDTNEDGELLSYNFGSKYRQIHDIVHSRSTYVVLGYISILLAAFFYKYHDNITWAEAYYFSVSIFWRLGFVISPDSAMRKSVWSQLFTIVYILYGVTVSLVLYSVTYLRGCLNKDKTRQFRVLFLAFLLISLIIGGACVGYFVMFRDKTFLASLIWAISTIYTWGTVSMPDDASQLALFGVALYAMLGCTVWFFFTVYVMAELEIAIQKDILLLASRQPLTKEEQMLVEQTRKMKTSVNDTMSAIGDIAAESSRSNSSEPIIVEGRKLLITLEESKHILLHRMLRMNVCGYYNHIHMWLPFVMLLVLCLGIIFYIFYDNVQSVATAVNYTCSAFFNMGYSEYSTGGYAEIMATVLMLIGWLTFGVLNVSIFREISLKPLYLYSLGTWIFISIVPILLFTVTIAFIVIYHFLVESGPWTRTILLAVDIFTAVGTVEDRSDTNASIWCINMYTIISVPLFRIVSSYIIAQLDISDQEGLIDGVIHRSYHNSDVRLLVQLDRENKRSYMEQGKRELYTLLILRLHDPCAEDLLLRMATRYTTAVESGICKEGVFIKDKEYVQEEMPVVWSFIWDLLRLYGLSNSDRRNSEQTDTRDYLQEASRNEHGIAL